MLDPSKGKSHPGTVLLKADFLKNPKLISFSLLVDDYKVKCSSSECVVPPSNPGQEVKITHTGSHDYDLVVKAFW